MDLQIKLANGCVLWCDASSFYDVYYIDIDDDRIELSDCDGFVIGILFQKARWKCIKSLYRCLIISMVAGRVVWGIVQCILLGLGENGFTISMFVAGAITKAIPGVILQLMLIPTVMLMLGKTHLVHMKKD